MPTIGLFLTTGVGATFFALPIRSSSALVAFSLPAFAVTFSVVATRACLVSLTFSFSVRFCPGLSAESLICFTADSPRGLARATR